jgi:hypothetical protein
MSGRRAFPLPEVLNIIQRYLMTCKVQKAIEEHRAVSG